MGTSYQRNDTKQGSIEVQDALENFVREGAQRMLAAALEEEVSTFRGVAGTSEAKPSVATETSTTLYGK